MDNLFDDVTMIPLTAKRPRKTWSTADKNLVLDYFSDYLGADSKHLPSKDTGMISSLAVAILSLQTNGFVKNFCSRTRLNVHGYKSDLRL